MGKLQTVPEKPVHILTLGVLLTLVLLTYTNQVDDLDLWWHLKSGEQILTTRSIPFTDSFSFTAETPASLASLGTNEVASQEIPSDFAHWSMNLNHSWLGQVILYLAFSSAGPVGIGLLLAIVCILTFIFLYLAMRRQGAGPVVSLLTLTLIIFVAKDFSYTRPQIFSFLCFAVLMYLYVDYIQGGRKLYLAPILMVFWANLHGGVILGTVALGLLICGELCRYIVYRIRQHSFPALSGRRLAILIIIGLLCLLASCLNPNIYKIYLFLIDP